MRCLLAVVFCLKAAQLSSTKLTNFDDKHVSESSSSLSESPQSKSDSLQLKSQDSSKLESKVLSVRSESSQSNTKSLRNQAEASQSKLDSNVFKSISTATPPSEGDSPTRYSFYYTGYPQTFYVPDGVTSIIIDAYGAQGAVTDYGIGGYGGYIESTVPVTPNTYLYIYVGGQRSSSTGGYNDRGQIYIYRSEGGGGGGGGGATDIRTVSDDLSIRIVVEGGGGGADWNGGSSFSYNAGGDGSITGLPGSSVGDSRESYGGQGRSQTEGGAKAYFSSF